MSRVLHFSGVMMIPGFVDSHGDVIWNYKIQKEFYNIDLSRFIVRVGHYGMSKNVKIVGQRLLSYPQVINDYLYPSGTWVVDMVTYEDKIIDYILDGQLIGLSIDGDGFNLSLSQEQYLNDVSKNKGYLTIVDFEDIDADWIVTGVSLVSNPSVGKALLFDLHLEEIEDLYEIDGNPQLISILKSADVSEEINMSYEPKLSKVQLDNSGEITDTVKDGEEMDGLNEKELDGFLTKLKKFLLGSKDEQVVEPSGDEPSGVEPSGDEPSGDEPDEDLSNVDVPNEELPNEELSNEDLPNKDVPNDDVPTDDVPTVVPTVLSDADLDFANGDGGNIKKGDIWLMRDDSELERKNEIKNLLGLNKK